MDNYTSNETVHSQTCSICGKSIHQHPLELIKAPEEWNQELKDSQLDSIIKENDERQEKWKTEWLEEATNFLDNHAKCE